MQKMRLLTQQEMQSIYGGSFLDNIISWFKRYTFRQKVDEHSWESGSKAGYNVVRICMVGDSIFKVLRMKKKMTIFLVMVQMAILGVAQTSEDSCLIRKDSLCQDLKKNEPDTINLSSRFFLSFTD